jgi:hypothetical protein
VEVTATAATESAVAAAIEALAAGTRANASR